ncbi:MAG TPA: hypothetical protein VF463_11445 [Sphingobium sp.]
MKTALLLSLAASLLAAASVPLAPVHAQEPDERINALVVYGSDPCPQSDDGTIIVCARKPENDRYRIPKELRKKEAEAVTIGAPGWASNVRSLEAAGRVLLPNSCSAVGTNGFTGCSLAMLSQWYAERQLEGRAPAAR